MENCDFCSEKIYKEQGIYENSLIKILYPRNPVSEGHLMLITKEHILSYDQMNNQQVIELKDSVSNIYKKLSANYEGYNLLTNTREAAGQHIPHLHIHMFLRKKDEINSPFDILSKKVERHVIPKDIWNENLDKFRKILG